MCSTPFSLFKKKSVTLLIISSHIFMNRSDYKLEELILLTTPQYCLLDIHKS